ncbi:hypothetical protein Tcan_01047, partial [Toxocara canis]
LQARETKESSRSEDQLEESLQRGGTSSEKPYGTLVDEAGERTTDRKRMEEICKRFYEQLFSSIVPVEAPDLSMPWSVPEVTPRRSKRRHVPRSRRKPQELIEYTRKKSSRRRNICKSVER